MAIDGAVSQTAVEAWDKRWATREGHADWLEPHPALWELKKLGIEPGEDFEIGKIDPAIARGLERC